MTGLAAMATVLVTDVVGSTALRVALGEEHADELRPPMTGLLARAAAQST